MTDIAEAIRKTPCSASTVPLAWYDCATYDEIKAMMSDGRAFASTYEQWARHALSVEAFFAAKGVETVRVPVHPKQFAQWCTARGREPDAMGRLAFSEWSAHSLAHHQGQP